MHRIAAIIPSFNRKDCLLQVLEDLHKQRCDSFELDLVAVIDGSTDGSQQAVRERFPQVQIVDGDGSWYYTRSINEGAACALKSNPDFILTLNDDIRLNADYVHTILNAHLNHERPNIMGSLSLTSDGDNKVTFAGITKINWWRMQWVNRIAPYTRINPKELSGVVPSMVLPGRGMLIPSRAFRELDMFDARFPQYGSDDDFCLRATERGYDILVSYDAVVHSHHRLTGKGNKANRSTIWETLKGFGDKYCTLYLPKSAMLISRHGNRWLLPLTLSVIIAASIRSSFRSSL